MQRKQTQGNRFVNISVVSPTAGIISRIPQEQVASTTRLRGLTKAENVRCDLGVIRSAPGYEVVGMSEVFTPITLIFQSNLSQAGSGDSLKQPIIFTGDSVLAVLGASIVPPPEITLAPEITFSI